MLLIHLFLFLEVILLEQGTLVKPQAMSCQAKSIHVEIICNNFFNEY